MKKKYTALTSALIAGLTLAQTVHMHHKHQQRKLRELSQRDYYPADSYSSLSKHDKKRVDNVFSLIVPNADARKHLHQMIKYYLIALDYTRERDTVHAQDLALVTDLTEERARCLVLAMSEQEILEHTAYSIPTSDKRLAYGTNYSRRPRAARVLHQISHHLKSDAKHPQRFLKFLRNNIAYNMYD